MLRRRVSVIRLGSRVPEVTKSRCVYVRKRPQSVRKPPQASASVRECRACVVVAKRRTVITFGLAPGPRVSKSFDSHRDRWGPGRKTQNCRRFWGLLAREGERIGDERKGEERRRYERRGEARKGDERRKGEETREERREASGERKEERGERQEEREERGERREGRGEGGGERGEERGERR